VVWQPGLPSGPNANWCPRTTFRVIPNIFALSERSFWATKNHYLTQQHVETHPSRTKRAGQASCVVDEPPSRETGGLSKPRGPLKTCKTRCLSSACCHVCLHPLLPFCGCRSVLRQDVLWLRSSCGIPTSCLYIMPCWPTGSGQFWLTTRI
jgi:hypothetical protein